MAGETGVRWLVYLTLLFRSLDIEAKTSQKIWKTPVDGGWVTTGPGYNDSFLREAGIVNAVFFGFDNANATVYYAEEGNNSLTPVKYGQFFRCKNLGKRVWWP